jgi:transcriptional regulator with XRE-family HTH domain
LIEARKKADLTQVEVAERLGKPQSFVAKYEGGERRLDVIEYVAVAKAIGIDPASLLSLLQD